MSGLARPVKDEDSAHPVAEVWRPVFKRVVAGLAAGEFEAVAEIPEVCFDASAIQQARDFIADYGETICPLPDDSWVTSISQWADPYWEVLVDLWTVESGASDLVISARVFELEDGRFRFELAGVYVP